MVSLTTQQYADLRGITPGAVRKAIRLKHSLPGVLFTKRFGKAHILFVEKANKKSLKKVA